MGHVATTEGIKGEDVRSGAHWCDLPERYGRKRGAKDQAPGRSRGGLTTRIHMLADTLGRPLRFRITPGQASDITTAPDLLEGQQADAVLADKAYDSNALREQIASMKAEAVIPSKQNRKVCIPHDTAIYKHRNQIERCFAASSISGGSQRATTGAPSTSPASYTSPQP